MGSRTVGVPGRRDGREPHYVLGLFATDCAEESLADRQLGFTTLDVRRHSVRPLGVAYGTESDQRNEDRCPVPAANRGRVRCSDRRTMCLLRRTDAATKLGGSITSVTSYGLNAVVKGGWRVEEYRPIETMTSAVGYRGF